MPEAETMEPWRKVFRDGFAPLLSTAGLEALRDALESDDRKLLQGTTTMPPPLQCVATWPVEAACAVTYCGVVDLGGFKREKGGRAAMVGEAEEFFATACFECNRALGEPEACRKFLNFFDDTPRAEMIRLFLPEVKRVLEERRVS